MRQHKSLRLTAPNGCLIELIKLWFVLFVILPATLLAAIYLICVVLS